MTESRVTCPNQYHHRLFEITSDGIAIKCRACRMIYVIPWTEVDRKRLELEASIRTDQVTALSCLPNV